MTYQLLKQVKERKRVLPGSIKKILIFFLFVVISLCTQKLNWPFSLLISGFEHHERSFRRRLLNLIHLITFLWRGWVLFILVIDPRRCWRLQHKTNSHFAEQNWARWCQNRCNLWSDLLKVQEAAETLSSGLNDLLPSALTGGTTVSIDYSTSKLRTLTYGS